MNPNKLPFATLLGTASFLTLAASLDAQAQQGAQAPATQVAQAQMAGAAPEAVPEQVLITGSLIRGTAAVGVPVVVPQRPTVGGFIAAGAALGNSGSAPDAEQVARDVVKLLRQPALRVAFGAKGRTLVDGCGSSRVADAIRDLVGPRVVRTRRAS